MQAAIDLRLADLATELEAARLMTYWMVIKLATEVDDPDVMLPCEAWMVKLLVTDTAKRAALQGMQMMGGSEYDMGLAAAPGPGHQGLRRHLRDPAEHPRQHAPLGRHQGGC